MKKNIFVYAIVIMIVVLVAILAIFPGFTPFKEEILIDTRNCTNSIVETVTGTEWDTIVEEISVPAGYEAINSVVVYGLSTSGVTYTIGLSDTLDAADWNPAYWDYVTYGTTTNVAAMNPHFAASPYSTWYIMLKFSASEGVQTKADCYSAGKYWKYVMGSEWVYNTNANDLDLTVDFTASSLTACLSLQDVQQLQVTFNAGCSQGNPTQYQWDWNNDGTYDWIEYDPIATHTYSAYGVYEVKLETTDALGDTATTTYDLDLSENYYPLRVYTKDSEGVIIPNALVAIGAGTPTSSGTVGYIDFSLRLGDYTVTVTKYNYEDWTGTASVPSVTQITSANTPVESTSVTFTVTVTDKDSGDAIENATVELSGAAFRQDITNSIGQAMFHNMVIGSYTVIVTADGHSKYTGSATVAATPLAQSKAVSLSAGIDFIPLIIGIIIATIVLVIFLVLAWFTMPPFRYIFLIVGISLSIVLFYVIAFMDVLGTLLG